MPCGTQLQICGNGGCILAQRQDACPGCSASVFDLSESAFMGVCGIDSGVCDATVSVVVTCDVDLAWEERPAPPVPPPNSLDELPEAPTLALGIAGSPPFENPNGAPVPAQPVSNPSGPTACER